MSQNKKALSSNATQDYIVIVANILGDAAGAFGVWGTFITTIKNAAVNAWQIKLQQKTIDFINQLASTIDNIEEKFTTLIESDQFAYHFYTSVYRIRDSYCEEELMSILISFAPILITITAATKAK